MKASMAQARYPMSDRGWLELSRREALVVTGVLAGLAVYLTALLAFI